MTKEEVQKLKHGLYRLYWTSGGNLLVAVGSLYDGSRWFAATNWTSNTTTKVIGSSHEAWDAVERVQYIEPPPEEEDLSPCHLVSKN